MHLAVRPSFPSCGNISICRPVARISRRGVTWMWKVYVCMHNHVRVGGSGGMLPQEIFRSNMLWDCFWGHFGTDMFVYNMFPCIFRKMVVTLGCLVAALNSWRWLTRRTTGELSSVWCIYTRVYAHPFSIRHLCTRSAFICWSSVNKRSRARWYINLMEAKRGVRSNPLEPPLPTGLVCA